MSERNFDVVALGELLIDFTENGVSGQGNSLFEANPGGAPCNVLAMLKKLGKSCAFLSKTVLQAVAAAINLQLSPPAQPSSFKDG